MFWNKAQYTTFINNFLRPPVFRLQLQLQNIHSVKVTFGTKFQICSILLTIACIKQTYRSLLMGILRMDTISQKIWSNFNVIPFLRLSLFHLSIAVNHSGSSVCLRMGIKPLEISLNSVLHLLCSIYNISFLAFTMIISVYYIYVMR